MIDDDRKTSSPENPPIVQRRGRVEPAFAGGGSAMAQRVAEIRGETLPPRGPRPPVARPWREPPAPRLPAPPSEPRTGDEPADRIVEDTRFGELFVLFIINLLLGILTLGIYRFWGKTRIRKYVWSHTEFRGDRFEYAGTGLELFLGFLTALLIFGPPFLGFYAWIYFDPPAPDDIGRFAMVYLFVFGLALFSMFFVHVATFAAYRYRASRTLWRGIRASVSGSAWTYGLLGFGLGLLHSITLFWTKPWGDTVLLRYRFSRTTIGSEPVHCTLTAGPLYKYFTLAWVLTLVATIVAIAGVIGSIAGFTEMMRGDTPPVTFIVIIVLLYLLVPVVWLATINWYRAALLRQLAATTRVQALRFAFPVGGWALLRFNFGNFLLLLLTLGLLLPLVIVRYARFVERYLRFSGDIDASAMRQAQDRGPKLGEGMAEFFGLGVI